MDAVLIGSIEWLQARTAAYDMIARLSGELDDLIQIGGIKDAYSPMAWLNICQQLRVVTDGMTAMRQHATGKTSIEIAAATGINRGSIAAYKAWNTMYGRSLQAFAEKRIRIKGRTTDERAADIAFLRSCGIGFRLEEVALTDEGKPR